MRISYTPEQEELRRELRSYFAKLITPERREALSAASGEVGEGNVYRETVAQMGKDGWLTLNWPKEYGGPHRNPIQEQPRQHEADSPDHHLRELKINRLNTRNKTKSTK